LENELKKLSAFLIGILIVLAFAGLHFASPDADLILPLNSRAGFSASIGLGLDEPPGQFTVQSNGATASYTDGNYQIRITETSTTAHSIIRFVVQKSSGEAFQLNDFSITARVPVDSIQGIWYPGANPSSTNVMVADATNSINDIADANYGIPYIAAASLSSRNVFAMGLGRQDLAVAISGTPTGSSYEFRLKAVTARFSTRFEESFYLSRDTSLSWSDAATDYADWVDATNNYVPFPISARAYEPLYDTWYWSGDRVDEQLYSETAKLASELGIGLYLADSGWDTDSGEYQKWLDGKTGDYNPPPSKFSNLSETFGEIRSEDNLGIDLWLQPFAVGRQSARYAGTEDMHIQLPLHRYAGLGWQGVTVQPFTLPLGNHSESVNLCPRLASTQTYLKNLFSEVAIKYKPQGYWLDFIDGMATYCNAPHSHTYALFGEGLRRSLETIKETVLSNDSQAIVHFRARYANLNTKPFASVWQSGDSPSDFDRMRLNSIRLRPFSKGVVFAADQMYWPEGIPESQVSKFIMTSVMVGVPAFGPTLLYSPPETMAMLKAWVSFYRDHQMQIATGRFSTFGQLAMPNHKIESGDQTFAYIRNLDFSEVEARGKTIFLMNATDSDRFAGRVRPSQLSLAYTVKIFSRYLIAEPNDMRVTADSKGFLDLDIAVEQGGMVQLTPIQGTPETKSPAPEGAGDLEIHHPTSPPAVVSCGGSCRNSSIIRELFR
jgi:hypothetical protein